MAKHDNPGLYAIVCGSRDGVPPGVGWDWFTRALDAFDREHGIGHVIHGDYRGIDREAKEWAKRRKRPCTAFPADWDRYKRGAGPVRNAAMLAFLCRVAESSRRVVLAFPGHDGTANMTSIAEEASVPVWRCAVAGKSSFEWTGGV